MDRRIYSIYMSCQLYLNGFADNGTHILYKCMGRHKTDSVLAKLYSWVELLMGPFKADPGNRCELERWQAIIDSLHF